jgi:phosphatidylinositol alpha-mannosyltransferase
MKIGLVCPYNIWKGGGVQECVLALQSELVIRGHDVKIITPQPRGHNGVIADHIITIGASTDIRSPFHTTSQVSASMDVEAIEEMLEAENFDLLHFHEPWVPFLSRQILAKSKAVNLATFHAKLPETVMSRTLERVVVPYLKSVQKYIDGLTSVSSAAAEYVRYVSPRSKVEIIPNGIDLTKYQPRPQTKTNPRRTILYIGRLEKRKGLKYLIQAFSVLTEQDKNVQLIIVGDGPDRLKLEDLIRINNIPRVQFLGYVSEKQKYNLLNSADLFCSPAIFGESFGIVLLEAMAMGVVTVAGNNTGYTSVLKDRGRISLVSPKDTEAFVHRLELLLYDDEIRQSWQTWAQEYVKNFDYKKVVDEYEQFYRRALTQSKKVRQ